MTRTVWKSVICNNAVYSLVYDHNEHGCVVIADLCRIAESTAQLRYLMQSMPQHPVMPDDRRLVPAIYVTTIKAFIQEGECKEAIDLCETLSSTFCYEGWLLLCLYSISNHIYGDWR